MRYLLCSRKASNVLRLYLIPFHIPALVRQKNGHGIHLNVPESGLNGPVLTTYSGGYMLVRQGFLLQINPATLTYNPPHT